jgi:hypothetical protein
VVILVRTVQEDGTIVKSYPSIEVVTTEKIIQAELQDKKIKEKICGIENNPEKKSLIQLKGGKKDIVKLHHYIGTELKPFIESLKLNNNDKQYIWGAINYHADKLKLVGETRLDRQRGHRNTWKNCIFLAGYSEEDAFELDWGNWVEIFDVTLATKDSRIIDWIISTKREKYDKEKDGSLQTWFRILRKAVTFRVSKERKIDTTYLDDDELKAELDAALATAEPDFKSTRDEVAKRKANNKAVVLAEIKKNPFIRELCEKEFFVNEQPPKDGICEGFEAVDFSNFKEIEKSRKAYFTDGSKPGTYIIRYNIEHASEFNAIAKKYSSSPKKKTDPKKKTSAAKKKKASGKGKQAR